MTAFDARPLTTIPLSVGIARLVAALRALASQIQLTASASHSQPGRLRERLARDAGEPFGDDPRTGGVSDALAGHGLSTAQAMDFITRDCRRSGL